MEGPVAHLQCSAMYHFKPWVLTHGYARKNVFMFKKFFVFMKYQPLSLHTVLCAVRRTLVG